MASNPNTPAYFVVSGKVTKVDGSIQQDVEVRVFDVDLRNEQSQGDQDISQGWILQDQIQNRAIQQGRERKGRLKIYAYKWFPPSSGSSSESSSRPGSPKPSSPIPSSPKPSPPKHAAAHVTIHFNASEKEIIDLVIGGAAVVSPSEFKRLVAAITPLLEGTKPGIADLVKDDRNKDDKNKDISFVAGETRESESTITLLVRSRLFSRQTDISPPVFYGLLREGLQDDLNTLVGDSAESLEQALQTAMDENIIDNMDAKTLATAISSLRARGAQLAIKTPPESPGSSVPAPLGALLAAALSEPSSFIAELSEFDGNAETFWKSVRANPDLEHKTGNVQFNVQVGIATMTHAARPGTGKTPSSWTDPGLLRSCEIQAE
ncbi:MAG: hypothetical protein M1839_004315 [Geoglossum umbratile]|nr:MAG: hypothetical protein M1839_004315 [Geoglossum umbratile]